MNIYSTSYVAGVVESLSRLPTFMLDLFFREQINHDTESVHLDKVQDKPRLTPFVHPLEAGKIVESKGYSTDILTPAYLKDTRVHNPRQMLKRRPGEGIGGTLSPQQRAQAALAMDLADMERMRLRRLEVMACEAIFHGRQTIKGQGFDAVVTFGRDASLTETLAGAEKWDAVTPPNIAEQIDEWTQEIVDLNGNVDLIVMSPGAWKLARKNPEFRKDLDLRFNAQTPFLLGPDKRPENVQFKGMYGNLPVYVYGGTYVDPFDNVAKPYMPANTVALVGSAVQGVRHFGAIEVIDVLQSLEWYYDTWTERRPSRRFLEGQCAPLMAPHFPNSTKLVTVA